MELKIRGIETAPGICEVFPAPNRFLRLPLGKGSCLLDPKTLTPMNLTLAESIRVHKGKSLEAQVRRIISRTLQEDWTIKCQILEKK